MIALHLWSSVSMNKHKLLLISQLLNFVSVYLTIK